jgi:endogenous inhibitor of DNA gyrase (YacG/DUF329 family)
MSGEDPWEPEMVATSNFRVRCPECGKQVQFAEGRRVEPDCGHELDAIQVEM